jgi:hypothetical protein
MLTTLIPFLAAFSACAALLAIATGSLISVLIWLLVFLVVCYLIFVVINLMPLEQPWKNIITIVVCLILLLVLVSQLGLI